MSESQPSCGQMQTPLPSLETPHPGGGGHKPNIDLQRPFLQELCRHMGLVCNDPLPAFEQDPPSLASMPVLCIDWSQPAEAYSGLVGSIVYHISNHDSTIKNHIKIIGGYSAAVNVCQPSFTQLFKCRRQQE